MLSESAAEPVKEMCFSGKGSETVLILNVKSLDEMVTVSLSNPSNANDVIICSFPLHRLLDLLGMEAEEKIVINIPQLVHCLGFKTLDVCVRVKLGEEECSTTLSNEDDQEEKEGTPTEENCIIMPEESKEFISSLANRKEELQNQLISILRGHRDLTNGDSFSEELQSLLKDPEYKVQWMVNPVVGRTLQFKEIYNELMKSLSNVFTPTYNLKEVSHPIIQYGLKSLNGLRYIVFLLCQLKIIPDPTVLKYAIVAETRFGSYRNAELLTLLFMEMFKIGIYPWTSGMSNEFYSFETSQLLIVFSLIIRHAPSAIVAIYYYEIVNQMINDIGLNTKPSNVIYACLIFNMVVTCKSADNQNDENILKMMTLIEHYYKEAKENNIGNEEVLDGIYQSFKNGNVEVPSPELDGEDELSETQSVLTFSSTATKAINISLSDHASYRMLERGIDSDEIKKCIKHGVRKLDRDVIKCTDGNCIVIYCKEKGVPHIVTVYRVSKSRTIHTSNSELCDYILTMGYYGDYNECNIVLKELLEDDKITLDEDEKNDLAETLSYLFKDCCPTYEGLKLIIQVMRKFNIVYSLNEYKAIKSVNPYRPMRGRGGRKH